MYDEFQCANQIVALSVRRHVCNDDNLVLRRVSNPAAIHSRILSPPSTRSGEIERLRYCGSDEMPFSGTRIEWTQLVMKYAV